jgi:dCMP deaminase
MNMDLFFITEAKRVAQNSKDPSTKVGCILTDMDYFFVQHGWNKHPKRTTGLSWKRPEKYGHVIHAEMAAILDLRLLANSPLCMQAFVTDAPCSNCLLHMIEAGVVRIVYEKADILCRWGDISEYEKIDRLMTASKIKVTNLEGKDLREDLEDTLGEPLFPPMLSTIPEGFRVVSKEELE